MVAEIRPEDLLTPRAEDEDQGDHYDRLVRIVGAYIIDDVQCDRCAPVPLPLRGLRHPRES